MAEQLFGSPGTSLVRSGVVRVAHGARSTTLAVCILWLHLSRESQSVWSMRTSEGSWRKGVKTSTSNPGSGNSTTATTDGTKQTGDTCGQRASLSACIKTQENTLAALPEGEPFESTRVYLQKEISEKKKENTESKQLAMRLASCKSAVDRAAAKRAACQDAVERATR